MRLVIIFIKLNSIFVRKFSLEINTPQLYEQFLAGIFDNQYKTISITSNAHRDILSEVKNFSNNVNSQIAFSDEHGNSIQLFTKEKRVKAEFEGDCNLHNLPNEYQWYEILFQSSAHYTATNVDAILRWKAAEKITLVFAGSIRPNNEPFWQRFYSLKKIHPEMERISYYRRP